MLSLVHSQAGGPLSLRGEAPGLGELRADVLNLAVLLLLRRPRLVEPFRGDAEPLPAVVVCDCRASGFQLARDSLEFGVDELLRGPRLLYAPVRHPQLLGRLVGRHVGALGDALERQARLRELRSDQSNLFILLLHLQPELLLRLARSLEGPSRLVGHTRRALQRAARVRQLRAGLPEVPLLLRHLLLELADALLHLPSRVFPLFVHPLRALLRALGPAPELLELLARGVELRGPVLEVTPRRVELALEVFNLGLKLGDFAGELGGVAKRLLSLERRGLGLVSLPSQLGHLALLGPRALARRLERRLEALELGPQAVSLLLFFLDPVERILRSLLALPEATLRILRATVHLRLLLPGLIPLALHLPGPRFEVSDAVPRLLELRPRLRLHPLRRLGGVVPVIDLLDELLHLGRAFVRGGGEELLGLPRLPTRVVRVPLRVVELVDGAVQLLLQPRAIAVAGFDRAEAVVGRLERLLRDGELRPGVVALLDDGVDVLSPAFAVARADEEAAPRRGGRPEASSEGVSPLGGAHGERAERVARDQAPGADGAREAAIGSIRV